MFLITDNACNSSKMRPMIFGPYNRDDPKSVEFICVTCLLYSAYPGVHVESVDRGGDGDVRVSRCAAPRARRLFAVVD